MARHRKMLPLAAVAVLCSLTTARADLPDPNLSIALSTITVCPDGSIPYSDFISGQLAPIVGAFVWIELAPGTRNSPSIWLESPYDDTQPFAYDRQKRWRGELGQAPLLGDLAEWANA